MSTTRQKTWTALWAPGWYELDQSLEVGQEGRFWFYQQPPADLPGVEDYDLVFFNHVCSAAPCQVRTARVVSIDHSELGSLERIDAQGLDYVFYPANDEAVLVNAEENPGTISRAARELPPIDNWSVAVVLDGLSDPVSEQA
jgi:hypothetical protein